MRRTQSYRAGLVDAVAAPAALPSSAEDAATRKVWVEAQLARWVSAQGSGFVQAISGHAADAQDVRGCEAGAVLGAVLGDGVGENDGSKVPPGRYRQIWNPGSPCE